MFIAQTDQTYFHLRQYSFLTNGLKPMIMRSVHIPTITTDLNICQPVRRAIAYLLAGEYKVF